MEQNQNPNPGSSLFSLNLDAQNSYTLRNTASWAKVLGVVSLIIAVLCIVYGVIAQQQISRMRDLDGLYRYRRSINTNTLASIGLVVYIIMAIVYGLSGFFALNAGNKINTGLKTNDMQTLNAGFAGARNFFALWTILMILFLILLLLGLAGNLSSM
ncbi:MAG: hypothetical protein HZB42_03910 [Sphingobacteriales bacterium]|nr:hypothetical protein [Sphingobacteriales bacterium]